MKKSVIVSEKAVALMSVLENLGFDVIPAGLNSSVDERIADHPDISYFFDGDNTLFLAGEYSQRAENFINSGIDTVVINDKLGDKYPFDVRLNCVTAGNNFICNKNTVSKTILDHMIKKGYNIIQVKQGYTKCSVITVSDNAIVTDDPSISEKCSQNGLDVLLVSKGYVSLQGFEYGFIGGTAGRVGERLLIFNGNITAHPDFACLSEFLEKHNVKYIFTEEMLTDIGSILPVYKIQE